MKKQLFPHLKRNENFKKMTIYMPVLCFFSLICASFICRNQSSPTSAKREIDSMSSSQFEWGFFAHRAINRQAVFSLPLPLTLFYKQNIDFIEREAVAPDTRRHTNEKEPFRHYIDLDRYPDSLIFKKTISWETACAIFGKEKVYHQGIVPFHIKKVYRQLINAWKNGNKEWILRLSADLGHYIGDANVPLHTTANYDGQLTNQEGIHAFWESTLVEKYFSTFNLWMEKAKYIVRVDSLIWKAVYASHKNVKIVLALDKSLSLQMKGKDYAYQKKRNGVIKMRSNQFIKSYYRQLDNMIEEAFRHSIWMISSFWYSAWIEAGQPDVRTKDFAN